MPSGLEQKPRRMTPQRYACLLAKVVAVLAVPVVVRFILLIGMGVGAAVELRLARSRADLQVARRREDADVARPAAGTTGHTEAPR